jgi:hypothetical protein
MANARMGHALFLSIWDHLNQLIGREPHKRTEREARMPRLSLSEHNQSIVAKQASAYLEESTPPESASSRAGKRRGRPPKSFLSPKERAALAFLEIGSPGRPKLGRAVRDADLVRALAELDRLRKRARRTGTKA